LYTNKRAYYIDGVVSMSYYPDPDTLERLIDEGYTYLPIAVKKKLLSFDYFSLFNKITKDNEYHFILESGKIGRYTYIGGNPLYIIKAKNGITEIINRDRIKREFSENPLDILEDFMRAYKTPQINELPKFSGGAIGYLSYDMAKYFEELPNIAKDDLTLPDLYFMIIDKVWVYDNEQEELWYIEHFELDDKDSLKDRYNEALKDLKAKWDEAFGRSQLKSEAVNIRMDKVDRSKIDTSFTKEEFILAVKKVQDYITEGDVFQVNLSVRQSRQLKSKGIDIYKHLRQINPSPYMGFINFSDLQLVSSSPELLIEIKDGLIQTRPIAGTRPRGKDKLEDEKLIKELIENDKEIAEHIMLVDLERNDLGRVCEYGTIRVNELMVVEKYSHVSHIVSNVVGKIDTHNNSIYDCIKATFPGGTITGAPKIRTMEIIEELEPIKRGPYTGSMGWIGFNNTLELNILIRTLVIKDGYGHIQAGAGIVIDSIPENEYIESLNKAEALWRAVESSEKEKEINL